MTVTVFWFLCIAPLLIWIYLSIIKKRKIQSIISISLLFFLISGFLLIGFYPGAEYIEELDSIQKITGKPFLLGRHIVAYDSPRSFNGDGYSIVVYKLKENELQYFNNVGQDFFDNYPQKYEDREDWSVSKWKVTPVNSEVRKLYWFIFGNPDRSNSNELVKAQDILREALNEKGNYYCYLYKMHPQVIGNIDLFCVSVKRKLFIIVNDNS